MTLPSPFMLQIVDGMVVSLQGAGPSLLREGEELPRPLASFLAPHQEQLWEDLLEQSTRKGVGAAFLHWRGGAGHRRLFTQICLLSPGVATVLLLDGVPVFGTGDQSLLEREIQGLIRDRSRRLREVEARFAALFDKHPDGLLLEDESGVFEGNDAAVRLLGLDGVWEMHGRSMAFLALRGKSPGAGSSTFPPARHLERPEHPFDWDLNLPEGGIQPVEVRCFSLPWEGRPVRCWILRDVLRRVRAEEALGESVLRYRSLFEDVREIAFVTDQDGRFLELNPMGRQLLGLEDGLDLHSVRSGGFYEQPQQRDQVLAVLRSEGRIKDYPVVLLGAHGPLHLRLSATLYWIDREEERFQVSGILWDVSPMVAQERALRELNQELRETQAQLIQQEKMASVGQLAAGIAHELNNPLGFVSSNMSTLERYVNQLVAGGGETFQQVGPESELAFVLSDLPDVFNETREGLRRMVEIVENMRRFSRIDSDDGLAPYDLNAGLRNTLVVARNEIKYVANVETELGALPEIACRGDEINQVLLNLLVNAAQAIRSQKRQDKGLIRVRTFHDPERSRIVCEVADDGPGISQEHLNRVFEPFFTTKPPGEGTGLGLNISYDIITRKHGGLMTASAPEDGGALFRFELPAQIQTDSGGQHV